MKIEKINENQIKCTLTKEDLERHEVRLSELAYGTEKARRLFQDMMEEAQLKFGFQADNIPLVIEAIPMRGDSIILIITKVEDPEELDTRFSKFAPADQPSISPEALLQFDGADSMIDLFQKIREAKSRLSKKPDAPVIDDSALRDTPDNINLLCLFRFRDLDTVILAARGLNGFYQGTNTLYKDRRQKEYFLAAHQGSHNAEEFNKVCNILSEYGGAEPFTPAGEAYMAEHLEMILADTAVQQLTTL